MNRQVDAVDKAAREHAKREAKTARQQTRHETIREMEETITVGIIATGVVLAIGVIGFVIWLCTHGIDQDAIIRDKNFNECVVEKGGTYIPTDPTDKNKYACVVPADG